MQVKQVGKSTVRLMGFAEQLVRFFGFQLPVELLHVQICNRFQRGAMTQLVIRRGKQAFKFVEVLKSLVQRFGQWL